MKNPRKQVNQEKLMNNKLTFFIITLLISFHLSVANANAQENSEESTNSAQEQTTKNLKSRIEKVVQEKREQIKGVIEKIYQKERGFVAQVQRISENSLTIKNSKGIQILSIDPEKVTILKNNKKIELSEIAIENWVVVMGVEEQDNFTVFRILVSEDSLYPKDYLVMLGSVTSIEKSSLQINPRNATEPISFNLGKNTKYQDLNGEEIQINQLEEESQVLIVGYKTENELTAVTIRSLAISTDEKE